MKQLNVPPYDVSELIVLRRTLIDSEAAQKCWRRNYGIYKKFKAHITASMRLEQDNRCAYCGTRLYEKNPHRDHIAPKSKYFQWTFCPMNLVLACYCCNTDHKGETDTVDTLAASYRRTTFKIVHPFFDRPEEHLEFAVSGNSILIVPKGGSTKGEFTINLFGLMSPDRAKERAKDLLFDEDANYLHGDTKQMFLEVVNEMAGCRLVSK